MDTHPLFITPTYFIFYRYGFSRLHDHTEERQRQILATYYKFMFVRHPITRFRSAYRMFKSLTESKEIASPKHIHNKRFSTLFKGDWVHAFPSYEEFAFTIGTHWRDIEEARNVHWRDQLSLCEPCTIKYDFIGKQEYLTEEGNYVLRQINASETFPNPIDGITSWTKSVKAFKELSKQTQHLVQGIYANDFQYLNYNKKMRYQDNVAPSA